MQKFKVKFTAEASMDAKFAVQANVVQADRSTVAMATDEGKAHGGDGTAPYPLSYFVTALASCFMVQARRFASVLNIDAGKIDLDLHGEWSAEVAEDGTYTGHPKAFRLDISFSGDASLADKTRLVQAAAAGCFVEAVMKDGILFHRIRHEDTWHDV